MKTFQIVICAALSMLMALSTLVNATEVLYEQTPIVVDGSGSSGVSSNSIDAIIEMSQVWDNFVITEQVEITAVHWTGQFNDEFGDNRGTNDFAIQFMPNLPTNRPDVLPASSIAAFTLNSGITGLNDGTDVKETVVDGQLQSKGGAVIRYEADVEPFTLSPGTYWMSIQGELTFPNPGTDPEYSWVFAADGGDKLLYSYDEKFDPRDSQPGISVPRDVAFSLIGNRLTTSLLGDFNGNGVLDVTDIDALSLALRESSTDSKFDVNGDGTFNAADHAHWVTSLKQTFRGDADLNNEVAFADFLALSGNFNTGSSWGEGDFDGSGTVEFSDFLALSGNFGKSNVAAGEPASVPEPSASLIASLGLLAIGSLRRRRS